MQLLRSSSDNLKFSILQDLRVGPRENRFKKLEFTFTFKRALIEIE